MKKVVFVFFALIIIVASCRSEQEKEKGYKCYLDGIGSTPPIIIEAKSDSVAYAIALKKLYIKQIAQKETFNPSSIYFDLVKDGKRISLDYQYSDKGKKIQDLVKEFVNDSLKIPNIVEKPKPKTIFDDADKIRSVLGNVGIGYLREGRLDDVGWISSSPYYEFGSKSSTNGMRNNLAYYIEGYVKSDINTIKLILNINNKEKANALAIMSGVAQKTFSALKLKMPTKLSSAIKSGNDFYEIMNGYTVTLTSVRSNITTWKLIISK